MRDSDRPIRICYVIGSLERCGTAIHLLGLLRRLDRSRFDPWVVVPSEEGPIADSIEALGIEVVRYRARSIYRPGTWKLPFVLARRIRRTRTHIVQSYLFFDNLIASLAGRMGGARAVITGRRTVDDWESPRHVRLYRLTNPLVDRIAVVSQQVKESVHRLEGVPPKKIVLILNAQSEETLRSRTDPQEGAILADLDQKVRGAFVFGSVGNIRPIKGHDVLVRAFHKLVQKGHNCHLVLVGVIYPGPPHIEALVETLGLKERVHFVGYRADVASFVERFAVFVLPSLAEGMSNALLEALILGKPVIATRFGLPQSPEGEDVVLGVEPGDVDGLAEAMERMLLERELREAFASRALRYAESVMDEGRMVREYQSLYEELVGSRSRGTP